VNETVTERGRKPRFNGILPSATAAGGREHPAGEGRLGAGLGLHESPMRSPYISQILLSS